MSTWDDYLKANIELFSTPELEGSISKLIGNIISHAKGNPNLILTAGNGGSATTADHFAADLSLTNKRIGYPIPAICLNSHLGLNTALANDVDYALALSEQLANFSFVNKTLIVFSASGNSKNLINLLSSGIELGITSWAVLGFDGGDIQKMPGVNSIVFPDKQRNYGNAENAHLILCHYVVDRINEILGVKP